MRARRAFLCLLLVATVSHVAIADWSVAPKTGPSARTPVGRRGEPMNVPRGTNADTAIGGRSYYSEQKILNDLSFSCV